MKGIPHPRSSRAKSRDRAQPSTVAQRVSTSAHWAEVYPELVEGLDMSGSGLGVQG